MNKLTKNINNSYIDFSSDVQKNIKLTILYGEPKNKSWGELIHLYDTLKYIENEYIDFKDYKIDTRKIIPGSVLHIRIERPIWRNECLLFDGFYIIISKSRTDIVVEKHATLAKAVREQRKKSATFGFAPIPNKGKWQNYQKHK
ncbi:hypothetical protein [Flavobacterium sp. S87F.05.LMB.W.Kidney.N]|uniref:hypothetical protein n=1 Tax=Flavobacterium sp. S87F.05.LMB.W.Kidney.N TaxID=1278758 RepID=UPI0010648BA1|nr:hypothetical protein [Flavobacterium sp. S87F.05.LMB.W.Kidney.N]TDX11309.1 hypothetical protein EDB96_2094 [Flavobacterium sp. S87F.05.LMB.W.Kidney.N]